MPIFKKKPRNAGFYVFDERQDPPISYDLTAEGERFLTIVMSLKDDDPVRPADLALLVDRAWAVPISVPEEPVETPSAPQPSPVLSAPKPTNPARRPDPARSNAARRTRAREVALQILYQMEQNAASDPDQMKLFLQRRLSDDRLQAFARALVSGVRDHLAELDDLISGVAENWRIDRMAAIDRNILRLGAFEILYCDEVPNKVAINEALELAKRYSTAQSSRFVNGILDRLQGSSPSLPDSVAAEHVPDSDPPAAP